jgi:5-hydroxyisourate hydrolase-like protein (transthyretin family)
MNPSNRQFLPAAAAANWCFRLLAELTRLFAAAGFVIAVLIGTPRPIRAADDPAKPAGDYTIHGTCFLWIENQRGDPKQPFDKIPQPKTRVTLYTVHGPFDPAEKIAETTTDEHGRFEFTGLVPPRTELHFDRLAYGVVAKAVGHPVAIFPYLEYTNRDDMRMAINEKSFRLLGKVVDPAGKPVAGATVSYGDIWGQVIPGLQSGVTDQAGHFKIDDVPIPWAMFREHGIGFRIRHPDFPPTVVSIESPDTGANFTLAAGCALSGTIVDEATGQPAAGVVVTAESGKSSAEDNFVRADDAGHYRLVVVAGNYNVVAEAADRVGAAATGLDCLAGQAIDVPPIKLAAGGWIEGQVLSSGTGEPIPTAHTRPIALGLFGPARPPRAGNRHISPLQLTKVDEQGRFRLRAAAGNNYPYLFNAQGRRMAWDTLKQPPVVVKAGETTHFDMLIDP